jgi:hypothetical protein
MKEQERAHVRDSAWLREFTGNRWRPSTEQGIWEMWTYRLREDWMGNTSKMMLVSAAVEMRGFSAV